MNHPCLALLVLAMTVFAPPADAAATGEHLFLESVGSGTGRGVPRPGKENGASLHR